MVNRAARGRSPIEKIFMAIALFGFIGCVAFQFGTGGITPRNDAPEFDRADVVNAVNALHQLPADVEPDPGDEVPARVVDR